MLSGDGVAFMGSARDPYLRADDVTTRKLLWRRRLPAAGRATPMRDRAAKNGRQVVVIAAGSHGPLGTGRGDSIVADALPKAGR